MGQKSNEFTATIKSNEDDFVPIEDDFEPEVLSDLDPIQGTPSFGALQGVKFNPDFPPEETPSKIPAEEPGLFDRIYGAVMNAPKFITEPVREMTQPLLEPKWDPQATET